MRICAWNAKGISTARSALTPAPWSASSKHRFLRTPREETRFFRAGSHAGNLLSVNAVLLYTRTVSRPDGQEGASTMNRVYRHQPLAPDEYLGWVDLQGQVFEARFGPDRKIGRVDPASGRIYEARLGPDQLIGRVDLETGRVYLARIGPDQHIGQVHADGKIYLHRRLARDEYIGRVREMSSL